MLPALPEVWSSGAVSGLCARGGFEVSMTWKDGKVTKAVISHRQGDCDKVYVKYNGKVKKLRIQRGKEKTLK